MQPALIVLNKAATLFLILILSQIAIAGSDTGQGALPLDSMRFPVTFNFELPPGINTSEQIDRYMEEHTLIVIGDRIDLSERMMVEGTKAQTPFLSSIEDANDSDATLSLMDGHFYKLIVLVGGPEHNRLTKIAKDRGYLDANKTEYLGFIIESGSDGNGTQVVSISSRSGMSGGDGVPQSAQYSPLKAFIPIEYVPVAATGISLILLVLINIGRTVIEFKALDFGRGGKKVNQGAVYVLHGRLNLREAAAVIGASIVLGISISWQYAGLDFWKWLVINSVICLIGAIMHELTHRIFAHVFNIKVEYRFWTLGSALTLISSYLGNAFSVQGFILEEIPENVEKWKVGLMKLSAPVVSALVMVAFALINLYSPSQIFRVIYSTSGLWAVTEMLPFSSLDGKDIKDWNKGVWLVFLILISLSYLVIMFLL